MLFRLSEEGGDEPVSYKKRTALAEKIWDLKEKVRNYGGNSNNQVVDSWTQTFCEPQDHD